MSDDNDNTGKYVAGAAAILAVGGGLIGWRVKKRRDAEAAHLMLERSIDASWRPHFSEAKRTVTLEQLDPDSLEWNLRLKPDGKYLFAAEAGRGEYMVVESTKKGQYGVAYRRFFHEGNRLVHAGASRSACIVAAYRDAARGRYLADRVKWTVDPHGRVHVAEIEDIDVRVRATPWSDIYGLFLLPQRSSRVSFHYAGDGELLDLKAQAVRMLQEDNEIRALPAVALHTNEGDAPWRYTDREANVIARATFPEGQFEIAYGEQRGQYNLRFNNGTTIRLLGTGHLNALLSEPRTFPGAQERHSRTFTEVVAVYNNERSKNLEAVTRRQQDQRVARIESRVESLERAAQHLLELTAQQAHSQEEILKVIADANERSDRKFERLIKLHERTTHVPLKPIPHDVASAAEHGAIDWARHIRELRTQIPMKIATRDRDAIYWVLDALEHAVTSGDDLEDIVGRRPRIMSGLGQYTKKPTPEDRAVGQALAWLASVSPLAVCENRQRWVVRLGQLETLNPAVVGTDLAP